MTRDMVLVYHYRHNGTPAVKDGLAVIRQAALDRIIEANPTLQATIKNITRGAMFVTIRQRDLLTASQLAGVDGTPNADANVASIRLPIRATVASVFDDKYWKLVILSKKL